MRTQTLLLEWHKVKAVNRSLVSANRIELVKQLSACMCWCVRCTPKPSVKVPFIDPQGGGKLRDSSRRRQRWRAEKKKGSSFQFAKDL